MTEKNKQKKPISCIIIISRKEKIEYQIETSSKTESLLGLAPGRTVDGVFERLCQELWPGGGVEGEAHRGLQHPTVLLAVPNLVQLCDKDGQNQI